MTNLRWLFVGQGVMGAAALESLIRAAPEAPVAALAGEPPIGAHPVTATARRHDLSLRHTAQVGAHPGDRWPELFADLDVVVSACWTERVAPSALRRPAHGWLNLHPSTLPAWRGADPVAWQLLAGAARIGCSVHRMTEGYDDGPVLADGTVPVDAGDDRDILLRRSGAELGRLAAGVLTDLAAGRRPAERPQRDEDATWCPPPGTVPLVDPRVLRAGAGARIARAFSPEPGVAVATLPTHQRFALPATADPSAGSAAAAAARGVGRELAAEEAPGAVADAGEGSTAIAFTDRWVHGRVRIVGPPSVTPLTDPEATRLPRGG